VPPAEVLDKLHRMSHGHFLLSSPLPVSAGACGGSPYYTVNCLSTSRTESPQDGVPVQLPRSAYRAELMEEGRTA
jgi:hypothetical protein